MGLDLAVPIAEPTSAAPTERSVTSAPHASPRIPRRRRRHDGGDRRARGPGAGRLRRHAQAAAQHQLVQGPGRDRRQDPAGRAEARLPRRSPPRTPRASPAPTPWPTRRAWRWPCIPSAAPGTHPAAVTLAPTDDWPAAIAASVLMAPPIRAPVLLSGSRVAAGGHRRRADRRSRRPAPAPPDGAQVIRVGSVPAPSGLQRGRDQGHRPLRAGGRHRSLRQRRRGAPEHRRGDRLRRAIPPTPCPPRAGRRRAATRCCSSAPPASRRPPGRRSCRTPSPTSTCSGRRA